VLAKQLKSNHGKWLCSCYLLLDTLTRLCCSCFFVQWLLLQLLACLQKYPAAAAAAVPSLPLLQVCAEPGGLLCAAAPPAPPHWRHPGGTGGRRDQQAGAATMCAQLQ
jgi:hypothetical protein